MNKTETKITIRVTEQERNQLKSILALRGMNVSEWVREQIAQFFAENQT